MEPEKELRILELRAKNLTPKQIARSLQIKVSDVANFLKNHAEKTAQEAIQSGDIYPIKECLIDPCTGYDLLKIGSPLELNNYCRGLSNVMITREKGRNKYVVASVLVDYWCMGVKDALGPQIIEDEEEYEYFRKMAYSRYGEQYRSISLEQAQSVIWGAVEYAKAMGFTPYRDFEAVIPHIGKLDNLLNLEFGHNGKPTYVRGPFDSVEVILENLKERVGEGNFEEIIPRFNFPLHVKLL